MWWWPMILITKACPLYFSLSPPICVPRFTGAALAYTLRAQRKRRGDAIVEITSAQITIA